MASDCAILLADGTPLLLEDGTDLLLANCTDVVPTGCEILLADGTAILLEDGTALLLANCGQQPAVVSGGFIRPKPRRIVVDLPETSEDDEVVATAVLALMRARRWRLDG